MRSVLKSLANILSSAMLFHKQPGLLPQTLNLFVTARCNARCEFCLYRHAVDNPTARDTEMRLEEYESLARAYGPLHYLAVSGGEPFVREDLADIVQAFIDHCQVRVVDIPSNFTFTKAMRAVMDRLTAANPEVAFDLQLSLDDLGERHDASRKVPGLFAKAQESFRAMDELRKHRPNLRIKGSTLYLPANAERLDEVLVELGRTFAFDRMSVSYPQMLLPSGGDQAVHADAAAYATRAERALAKASPCRRRADLHVAGMLAVKGMYRRLLLEAASGARNTGGYCEAGRHMLVIDQEGRVFPCEPLWHCIGNLRETGCDPRPILAGKPYAEFRAARLGPGKCNCTWSCAMHTAIAVTPGMLPELAVRGLGILVRRLMGGSC
ncbi:MAG: radical SAM protein [Desulfovibrio sp.]